MVSLTRSGRDRKVIDPMPEVTNRTAVARAPGPVTRARREAGFTLLEMIVVIALIGILATIAMPALRPVPTKAKEAVLKTNLLTIRDVLDQYHADKGHYPSTLDALVEDGYLRKIPIDPFTKSSESWVLEYEEVDPELEPAETDLPDDGAPGIFDVHSGAEGESLDGTPYSEW